MSDILVVTGASRGIGAAIARLGGRAGYDVAVNYLTSRAGAEAVVADIEAAGRRAIAVQGDMGCEGDILRLFETVDRELGTLGALVANAGLLTSLGRVEELEAADLKRILEVNTMGAFLCCREAVKRMSTRHGGAGGAIVTMSSAASTLGSPNEFVSYAASKAAVDALTYGLAKEVALDGIRVNAVNPGYIESDIHYPGRYEKIVPTVPMQRAGTPEDVAEAVLFLLSEKANYITGTNLRIAGGR